MARDVAVRRDVAVGGDVRRSARCDIAISQYHTATNPYFANTSFPTGTKVSRGGFMRCPFREIATAPQSGASQ